MKEIDEFHVYLGDELELYSNDWPWYIEGEHPDGTLFRAHIHVRKLYCYTDEPTIGNQLRRRFAHLLMRLRMFPQGIKLVVEEEV